MPFAGQIPGVVMDVGASGSSILEVFARNLFTNMDTGEVYLRSGDRSPITTWPAKRGDRIPVQQRFVNEELDGTDELIKLPEGVSIRFEGHRKLANGSADYSQLLVQQNTWVETDATTDPHYDATVDLDTPAINAAIGKGGLELPYIDIEADVEVWKGEDRLSSANFTIRLYNDHARGEGDVPTSLGFIGSGVNFGSWITALTGGTATDLDGQATAHLEYGKTLLIIQREGEPPESYRYVEDPAPGATVEDSPNVIIPDDYAYDPENPGADGENIGLWVKVV
ncbi:MAG TPA: hypothetical protein PLU30_25230 [Verrucomicrobiae bacterium]|nr:hypothetical protein [Verrucomicrobiae bacterium]